MVTEVSATLVATTTLRRRLGAKARSCSSGGNSPCKGISASGSRPPAARQAEMVALISPMPGMKIRMSPGSPALNDVRHDIGGLLGDGALVEQGDVADFHRKGFALGNQEWGSRPGISQPARPRAWRT